MIAASIFSDRRASARPLEDRVGRGVRGWHHALILGAVLSLTINVATRYCQVTSTDTQVEAVKSRSLDAQRQHLLNDGFHWSIPASAFVLFKPTPFVAAVLPDTFPLNCLHSEVCSYNRPPPSR
jgi:hypothetical protein